MKGKYKKPKISIINADGWGGTCEGGSGAFSYCVGGSAPGGSCQNGGAPRY